MFLRSFRLKFLIIALVALLASFQLNAPNAYAIHCDSCGPYTEVCQGVETYITLDGSGSTGNGIDYSWSTDCPNTDLLNPNSVFPTLILYDPGIGVAANCKVYLSVTEQTVCECQECTCEDQCESTVQVPACNLDCEGTPNGTKVLDLCGVCGGDNSTCKGCDDVPNSGKVLDRCDVCDGDGTSCLGCSSVDVLQTQFALDGNSLAQKVLVDYAAKLILKTTRSSAKSKKFVSTVKLEASKLYQSGWTLTWSLPNIITSCTNQIFCTSIDNSGPIQTFNANSDALYNLLSKTVTKLQKERHKKLKSDKKLIAKGLDLHNKNLSLSSTVPVTASACS